MVCTWDALDRLFTPEGRAPDRVAAAREHHRHAPPEVRPDGSATEAEITRMRYGPVPGTWRARSTAENDRWYVR